MNSNQNNNDIVCSICLEKPSPLANINKCTHIFCFDCILKWSKISNTCPMCKSKFTKIDYIKLDKNKGKNVKEIVEIENVDQRQTLTTEMIFSRRIMLRFISSYSNIVRNSNNVGTLTENYRRIGRDINNIIDGEFREHFNRIQEHVNNVINNNNQNINLNRSLPLRSTTVRIPVSTRQTINPQERISNGIRNSYASRRRRRMGESTDNTNIPQLRNIPIQQDNPTTQGEVIIKSLRSRDIVITRPT